MGLGAGGRMRQEIYPDPYGADTWEEESSGRLFVQLANSEVYREITGVAPPPTPVSAQMYTECGLPWFDLYDEGKGDLAPSEELAGVQSIGQLDNEKGLGPDSEDETVDVSAMQVKVLGGPVKVKDGNW